MEPLSREDLRKLIQARANQLGISNFPPREEVGEEPLYVQDLKVRAERRRMTPAQVYAEDRAVLQREPPLSADCLKPDEVLLLFSNPGKMELARLAHLEHCPSCRSMDAHAKVSLERARALAAQIAEQKESPALPEPSRLSLWVDSALDRLNEVPGLALRKAVPFSLGAACVLFLSLVWQPLASLRQPTAPSVGSLLPWPGATSDVFVKAGSVDMWSGDSRSAYELARQAIGMDPKNPYPYLLRAGAEWRLGHREKAENDLAKAIELADNPALKQQFIECRYTINSAEATGAQVDLWNWCAALTPWFAEHGAAPADSANPAKATRTPPAPSNASRPADQ